MRGFIPHGAFPAGFYEGPFGQKFLTSLGIRARMIRAMTVSLEVNEKWAEEITLCTLFATRVTCCDAFRSNAESSPCLTSMRRIIRYWMCVQFSSDLNPSRLACDRTNAYRDPKRPPCDNSNGKLTLAGLPLFDIVCRKHWMPPINDGYYTIESEPVSAATERWFAHFIIKAALAAGHTLVMLDHWPEGRRAALTLRLDHDRAISQQSVSDLLKFLNSKGVLASWGFLARLVPPEAIAAVQQCGHEIVLHSEAPDAERLKREVMQFRTQGVHLRGVTAHGGTGSAGHLGQNYFEWAREAGLDHAELLSRDTLFPHPTVALHDRQLSSEDFYNITAHQSLDLGTAVDAHQLDHLLSEVPKLLAAGEHVTLMNHPDIHRQELKVLLNTLVDRDLWCATHGQTVDWSRSIKHGWKLASAHDGLMVSFPRSPEHSFQLRVIGSEQQLAVSCSKGTNAVFVPKAWLEDYKRSAVPAAVPKSNSRASLTGVFTASRDRLGADLEAAGPLISRLAIREKDFESGSGPLAMRCFAQSDGDFWFPRNHEETGCAYVPLTSRTFHTVFLGRSLRLFRNAWGTAFIRHAARALVPEGQLMISFSNAGVDQGFWRLSDLVTFFGTDPIEIADEHAVFLIDKVPSEPRSILDWFYEGFADLMMFEMQNSHDRSARLRCARRSTTLGIYNECLPGELDAG